jgi:hypothetical protein
LEFDHSNAAVSSTVYLGEMSEMDERFFGVADSDGCQEGSSEWGDGVDALGDAFGCEEDAAKGLG